MGLRRKRIETGSILNINSKYKEEVTKSLLLVVAVFLLARLVCSINKFLSHLQEEDVEFQRSWYFMKPVEELLLILNSSINFLIYCLIAKKFQNEFLHLLK